MKIRQTTFSPALIFTILSSDQKNTVSKIYYFIVVIFFDFDRLHMALSFTANNRSQKIMKVMRKKKRKKMKEQRKTTKKKMTMTMMKRKR